MTITRSFLSERLYRGTVRAMDPLADVLDLSRVRGALLGNVRAAAPWGLALPQSEGASFHAVTSGTAWLRVGDEDPIQLMPGDLRCCRPARRIGCRRSPTATAARSTARSRTR